jgi:hypothetical protein
MDIKKLFYLNRTMFFKALFRAPISESEITPYFFIILFVLTVWIWSQRPFYSLGKCFD